MSSKKLNLKNILESNKTFVIAEIGQNHQGDIKLAKKLIKTAKECGADCVKFQKTCLEEKFTSAALARPYSSENSFGCTYGAHKEYLEFTKNQFITLQKYAEQEIGVMFSASPMDIKSMDFLISIKVPFIKIGSGDADNFLMLRRAAQSKIPLIISTGMLEFETVKAIYELISQYHKDFALLHCVSAYPTPYEDINLNVINLYKQQFPDIPIGYSGHELGVHITVASVALGAKIVERHITLDKNLKGTDHKCSLNPIEFNQLVQQIKDVETAIGEPVKLMRKSEKTCYEKLGKSIVFAKDLLQGEIIKLQDLNVKVTVSKGLSGSKIQNIVGKVLRKDVKKDVPVALEHLY